jgi:hypothetical protein
MSVIPQTPRASGGLSSPGPSTSAVPWTRWGPSAVLRPHAPPNHKSWIRPWFRRVFRDGAIMERINFRDRIVGNVWRDGLWYKLLMCNIKGKMYNVILNPYNNIKSRIDYYDSCFKFLPMFKQC